MRRTAAIERAVRDSGLPHLIHEAVREGLMGGDEAVGLA
jgi:hypothetical protein